MTTRAQQHAPESAAELEQQLAALREQRDDDDNAARRGGEEAALLKKLAEARARERARENERDLGNLITLEAGHRAAVQRELLKLAGLDTALARIETMGSAAVELREKLRRRGVAVPAPRIVRTLIPGCSAVSIESLRALAAVFAALSGSRGGLWLLPAARPEKQ